MRNILRASLAAPAALGVIVLAGTAASAETYTMRLTDTMANNSGSSATAVVVVTGDSMKLTITGKGFTPNQPHAQHFHGSFSQAKNFTCPTGSADKDGDGQVNTEEGLPMYGDIIISLTTSGDTSPASGLAVERMPKADANGNLSYSRTIALPAGAGAKLKNLHIVQHGLDVNGNGAYDLQGLGESTFAKSLGVNGIPEEATNPATCGTVSGATVGAAPTGGVETGSGAQERLESPMMLGLGAAALVGAGGLVLYGRRQRVES